MKYKLEQCVKNTVKKKYTNGDIIEINTEGSIKKLYPFSKRYLVMFEGAKMTHKVLENDLKEC